MFASLWQSSEAAARRQLELIWHAGDQLATFPLSGATFSSDPVERKLPVAGTKYLIYCRYRDNLVEITAVLHGAQEPPTSFPA